MLPSEEKAPAADQRGESHAVVEPSDFVDVADNNMSHTKTEQDLEHATSNNSSFFGKLCWIFTGWCGRQEEPQVIDEQQEFAESIDSKHDDKDEKKSDTETTRDRLVALEEQNKHVLQRVGVLESTQTQQSQLLQVVLTSLCMKGVQTPGGEGHRMIKQRSTSTPGNEDDDEDELDEETKKFLSYVKPLAHSSNLNPHNLTKWTSSELDLLQAQMVQEHRRMSDKTSAPNTSNNSLLRKQSTKSDSEWSKQSFEEDAQHAHLQVVNGNDITDGSEDSSDGAEQSGREERNESRK